MKTMSLDSDSIIRNIVSKDLQRMLQEGSAKNKIPKPSYVPKKKIRIKNSPCCEDPVNYIPERVSVPVDSKPEKTY